jgi:glycosyltransferase involved in cell wall biosynthesis
MRIGIDARFFGPSAKGLGRYTQKLIEELEKNDSQNDYLIFLRRKNFNEYQPKNPNFKKIIADYQWYSLAEQLVFPLLLYRQKIDLMHFPHFNAPIFYFRPFVVTIHDLILQKFGTARGWFFGRIRYWFKGFGYKIVIRIVLARAKKIITVSQYVKTDIIKIFWINEGKINVIYEGVSEIKVKDEGQKPKEVLDKYRIKIPYLLYVGNAYPHKNLLRLAEAFRILKEKYLLNLQLVLVGGEDYFYRQLKKRNCDNQGKCFGGGVVFTGFVDDEELGILYKNADLYVFPSLCEGFGLPPLEAMSHGLPVASSSATCLPEILGQSAVYFDATNKDDIANKIKQILSDDNLRQKTIENGFTQIKKYSWQKMAEETKRIYFK